jgi:hypothetical protein
MELMQGMKTKGSGSETAGLLYSVVEVASLLHGSSDAVVAERALNLGHFLDNDEYLFLGEELLRQRTLSVKDDAERRFLELFTEEFKSGLSRAKSTFRLNLLGDSSIKELALGVDGRLLLLRFVQGGWIAVAFIERAELPAHIVQLTTNGSAGFVLEHEGDGAESTGIAWDGSSSLAVKSRLTDWECTTAEIDAVGHALEEFLGKLADGLPE